MSQATQKEKKREFSCEESAEHDSLKRVGNVYVLLMSPWCMKVFGSTLLIFFFVIFDASARFYAISQFLQLIKHRGDENNFLSTLVIKNNLMRTNTK